MPYFNTCPNCGASLDPGETCDCTSEEEERKTRIEDYIRQVVKTDQPKDGQLRLAV